MANGTSMGFIQRIAGRIKTSAAATDMVRWLSNLSAYAPLSVVVPSTDSLKKGLPSVEAFRGLRGITELQRADGVIEWHLTWSNDWAADMGEAEYIRQLGATQFSRSRIRRAHSIKPAWWRRTWPWTVATGILASVAAAGSHVESIKSLYSQLRHEPLVTVETTDVLRAGSDRLQEETKVTLRGDPYFRTRVEGVRMKIVLAEEGEVSQVARLVDIPSSNLSLDVSAVVPLRLPLGALPAGRYRIELTGRAHTSWKSAELRMAQPLTLDVRKRLTLRNTLISAYPDTPSADGKFTAGLADFALDFGRLDRSLADVRIVLKGNWVDWSMEFKPTKASLSKESDNSTSAPKSIVFSLQQMPVVSFGSDTFRIWAKSAHAMTEREWRAVLSASMAQITNLE
jgi:hypothetical protein